MKANYTPKNYTEQSSKSHPLLSVATSTSGLARTGDAPGVLYLLLSVARILLGEKNGETWL